MYRIRGLEDSFSKISEIDRKSDTSLETSQVALSCHFF
jgi:hypothetical protein